MAFPVRTILAAATIPAFLLTLFVPLSDVQARTVCENSKIGGKSSVEPMTLDGPSAGLLTFFRDHRRGRVYLKVPPVRTGKVELGTYIFLSSLRSGLGSHRFPLTRGRFRQGGVITISRLGDRVIIQRENSRYVTSSADPAAQRAVRESFPTSIYWVGCVETRPTQDKSEVVDITDFFLRDFAGVVRDLKRRKEGQFKLDRRLSFVDPAALKVFPDNIEMEGTLSFSSGSPGRQIRRTMASPESLTLVQHISIVRRPGSGFTPRNFDPRAGLFHNRQFQFGRGSDKPLDHRYIVRHRLQKTNPNAERSTAKKPIVFYVDRSMPKPYRDAVLAGARWWKPAFEKIGFVDGFQVKLLPPGADILDARYNVLQLVHRTRTAFSDGLSIRDSRTGEVVRSVISLDSQRARRYREHYEALVGAAGTGAGSVNDPLRAALARIRWLAAHEVGHALGFRHNFAASSFGNGRESVMDYAVPRIKITPAGQLDLSNAYLEGLGAWDYFLVKFAYTEFPKDADETAELKKMVDQAQKDGLLFLSDGDASRRGGIHPMAAQYDNGPDPLADLEHLMQVRKIALNNFGPGNLQPDQPLALLRERFKSVYFLHSRQARNVARLIGGTEYRHSLSGTPQEMQLVDPDLQREAIAALVALTEPSVLDIPERILAVFPPRTIGYWRDRKKPRDRTGRSFDALGVAVRAANGIFNALLAPARVSRLVDLHRRNVAVPALDDLLNALTDAVFRTASEPERHAEIRRAVQKSLVDKLQTLSLNKDASDAARARVESHLAALLDRLKQTADRSAVDAKHTKWLADRIRRLLDRPFGSDGDMMAQNRRRGRSGAVDSETLVYPADGEPSVFFSDAAIIWHD